MQLPKIALGCFRILGSVAYATAVGSGASPTDGAGASVVVESRRHAVTTADAASADAADASTTGPDAGSAAIWHPQPGTSWQWQLSGSLDTSFNVQMYDIDLFDNSASTISSLQSRSIKVICYLSAGSYEPGRPDSNQFPSSVLGN